MSNIPTIQFDIYQGDTLLRTEKFHQEIIKIGRLSRSHLRLEDENVSRMQSIVEVGKDGTVMIIDLGSAKGTYVNDQKVNKAQLKNGDSVLLGDTKLVVKIGEAAADSASVQITDQAMTPIVPREIPKEEGTAVISAMPDSIAAPAGYVPQPSLPASFEELYYTTGQRDLRAEQLSDRMAIEVIALWNNGVISADNFLEAKPIVIGETKLANVFVPAEILGGKQEYTLIDFEGDKPILNLNLDNIGGDVLISGRVTPISELRGSGQVKRGQYPLAEGVKCRIHMDKNFTVLVNFAKLTKKPAAGLSVDVPVASFNALSVIIHLLFLIVIWAFPEDVMKMKGDDPFDPRDQHFQTLLEKSRDQQQDELEMELEKKKGGKDEQEQEKMAAPGKEGQSGKRDAPKRDRSFSVSGNSKKLKIAKMREKWKKQALKKGLANVLLSDNKIKSLYTNDKETLGPGVIDARGIIGSKAPAGDSLGYDGLGTKGLNPGGGGPLNSVSLGRNKTGIVGIGGPKGPGGKFHRTGVNFKDRRRRVTVAQLTPMTIGDLPKEVIRRIMRKNYNAFRYCYEQELTRKVNLKGKIALKFTIDPTGRVISSGIAQSTMSNRNVEQCLVKAVRRIRFPAPKNGGIVQVSSYPFIFTAN
ncbi:MAG: TonB family protein [Myxococcales bacterium]|nr:TonB family protein [Myxococcales bacterium]